MERGARTGLVPHPACKQTSLTAVVRCARSWYARIHHSTMSVEDEVIKRRWCNMLSMCSGRTTRTRWCVTRCYLPRCACARAKRPSGGPIGKEKRWRDMLALGGDRQSFAWCRSSRMRTVAVSYKRHSA